MALTNSQYDTIIRTYEEKQLSNRRSLEERQLFVNTHVAGYQELSQQVASLSVKHAKLLLNGDQTALNKLKQSLKELHIQKKKLLMDAGLPADFLQLQYSCPHCQDTGYIGQEKCHCFKQQIISLLYEQSNIKDLLKQNNFSQLSYEFYKDEDLTRFQTVVESCYNFINSFKSDYHNLCFCGTVGTGKSFLSGCIAKELMDLGHSVIYFSSTGLFDKISQYAFDYNSKDSLSDLYEDLYSCDLLIVDDLGTELTNTFSSSQFFSILNERILRKKSIIISTNLSLEELRERYADRIFSRITSNFTLCRITGPDIRMYKKRLSNRK